MRRLQVKVHKTELAAPIAVVFPWELALLQAIHANGVIVEAELPSEGQEAPDPVVEYERLERKYKVFREDNGDPTDRTVVGEVYGRHQAGIRALAEAINAEVKRSRPRKASAQNDGTGEGSSTSTSEAA